MTEEERNLMIKMAKTLDEHGAAIRANQASILEILSHQDKPAQTKTAVSGMNLVSTIEKHDAGQEFKLDVTFEGGLELPANERMNRTLKFFGDLNNLMARYHVAKINGSFLRKNYGMV